MLSVIAEKMRTKLLAYEQNDCTRSAELESVLDLAF